MMRKLDVALRHHQAGHLQYAESLYREILRDEPNNPDALHLLGMVAHRLGRHEEAIKCILQAIGLTPDFAEYHNNLATVYLDLGNYEAGAASCREALRCQPELPQAHLNLGNALQGLGHLDEAVISYQHALRISPNYAQAHANLGGLWQRLGQLDEAAASCQKALAIQPNLPDALNNLGETYRSQGKPHLAVPCFERALAGNPGSADIHNNLGNALKEVDRLEDAVACYRRAIEIRPTFAQAHNNLGVALRDHGRLAQAAQSLEMALAIEPNYAQAHSNLADVLRLSNQLDEAAIRYRRALELVPHDAEVQNNLGEVQWQRRQTKEAIACFEQAIAAEPALPSGHYNLGNALRDQGDLEGAAASYRRALAHDSNFSAACNNLALTLSEQGKCGEALEYFRRALAINPLDSRLHSHVLVCQQYLADVSLASQARDHADWDERHAAPFKAEWPLTCNDPNPNRPLRIGFVSRDFRRHPVGYFLVRALEALDRSNYETICYCDQAEEDDVTRRLQAAAASWHIVNRLSDEQLTNRIRADAVDILVDLAGHTAANRLLVFARKAAPIQATWMGYVGTTGMQAMDYLISDRFHTPPGDEPFYREKILRLPDGYVCYHPPDYAPAVHSLPALAEGHVTFGSFNNPAKISPEAVGIWARILNRVPESRLVLKYGGLDDRGAQRHFWELFAAAGIAAERVWLLGPSPHEELLEYYNRIDIALDPFPYSGGLTTCEALWMGVPVITCPGKTFAGRHAFSHLSNAGLPGTVALDLDDYVERAVKLAEHLDELAKMRSHLRHAVASSPLCDGARFARGLERAFRQMWCGLCES